MVAKKDIGHPDNTCGRIIMMQNSGKVMVEVIDLDSQRPHEFYEAMCAKCLDRWLAVGWRGAKGCGLQKLWAGVRYPDGTAN